MPRSLQLVAVVALLCCSCWGSIAASHVGSQTATSGTLVSTVTINAGDTVVVGVLMSSAAARTASAADSSGVNTYTSQVATSNGSNVQVAILTAANVTNSATSVTVTISGTYNRADVVVSTYTGVGSNGVGTNNVQQGSSTTPTIALTTQDANNFVVACFAQAFSGAITFSANVGNLRVQQAGGTTNAAGINDNTAVSAGSVTNTATSNRNGNWAAVAVELRSTGGGASQSRSVSETLTEADSAAIGFAPGGPSLSLATSAAVTLNFGTGSTLALTTSPAVKMGLGTAPSLALTTSSSVSRIAAFSRPLALTLTEFDSAAELLTASRAVSASLSTADGVSATKASGAGHKNGFIIITRVQGESRRGL